MTLGELAICFAGLKERKKDEEARDAWLLVNLIQPHVSTSLRMLDFMPTAKQERLEQLRDWQEQGIVDPREAVI